MKKITTRLVILTLLTMTFLTTCGTDPPYIVSAQYAVLIYQQNSVQNMLSDNAYLSIFCVIAGDTEDHNLKEMKITHLDTEYSWTIEEKNLTTYNYHDTIYTGFPFIEYEDGSTLLSGNYLIEIFDKTDNMSDFVMDVSIPGKKDTFRIDEYEVPYKASLIRSNRELSIECKSGAQYSSAEIMFLNNTSIFSGGRKKYNYGDRILFDGSYHINESSKISVRLNTGTDENIIYYLTPVAGSAVVGTNDDDHHDATDDVSSDFNIITQTKGLFDRIKDGLFKKK